MKKNENELSIAAIHRDVDLELQNSETMKTLIATTFKKLSPESVKGAMVEGYLRGFTLKDFLEKNIYAVPYGETYSLVTSIDYARKMGAKSGIVGKDSPQFEVDKATGAIISCTVTVHKRQADGYVGDFTATVYFAEYRGQKPIWDQKPRTMIAKVAEMHALRQACPAELSASYVEEELEKKEGTTAAPVKTDTTEYRLKLESVGTTKDLQDVYVAFPGKVKAELYDLKEKMKAEFAKKGI